jgi:hypothetical protein
MEMKISAISNTRMIDFVFLLLFFFTNTFISIAQDSLPNGRAFNFPANKYGISIGNSREFNGIRFNFADKNVKKINGFNFTLWTENVKELFFWKNETTLNSSIVNGISIGIIPIARSMQPINIGVLAIGTSPDNLNGITISGILLGSTGNLNGISFSGLMTQVDAISGIAISGLLVNGVGGINGLAVSGLIISSDTRNINGMAICPGILFCGFNFRGVGISGIYAQAESFEGLSIAAYAKTREMHGLSIGLFNKTNNLHGMQIGLLNYAGNNPKLLRLLPFFNLHF